MLNHPDRDDNGRPITFPLSEDLTKPQCEMLRMLDQWDGDLPPDAEERIGCRGEAFWCVLDALKRRNLITDGPWSTYLLTPSGEAFVKHYFHSKGATE